MNTLGATVVLASNDVLPTSGPLVVGACFWVLEATLSAENGYRNHQQRPKGTYRYTWLQSLKPPKERHMNKSVSLAVVEEAMDKWGPPKACGGRRSTKTYHCLLHRSGIILRRGSLACPQSNHQSTIKLMRTQPRAGRSEC